MNFAGPISSGMVLSGTLTRDVSEAFNLIIKLEIPADTGGLINTILLIKKIFRNKPKEY